MGIQHGTHHRGGLGQNMIPILDRVSVARTGGASRGHSCQRDADERRGQRRWTVKVDSEGGDDAAHVLGCIV